MKEAVELMLQNGADVTAKDDRSVRIYSTFYEELVESFQGVSNFSLFIFFRSIETVQKYRTGKNEHHKIL